MHLDNSGAQSCLNVGPTNPILKKDQQDYQMGRKSGHWSVNEHQQYLDFLHESKELMDQHQNSKGQRLFKKMSSIIGTRTPSQCRSHHQKFNPFNSQLYKKKKIRRPVKQSPRIHEGQYIRSKQYYRKYFASIRVNSDTEEDHQMEIEGQQQ